MINTIENRTLWKSGDSGSAYFHPRPCLFSDGGKQSIFMTMQKIGGSDVFRNVRWTTSDDNGQSWSDPQDIPEMGWKPFYEDVFEGVCDVVPDYHPQTDTILTIGQSVYYQNDKLLDCAGTWDKENIGYQMKFKRSPVYSVRNPDGTWVTRKKLDAGVFASCRSFCCGCAQKVWLKNGHLLIPFYFSVEDDPAHRVCSVEFGFDGRELVVIQKGNDIELPVKRGLLEPSMTTFAGKYWITIRAEDDRGYVAVSDDGLNWGEIIPWCWSDGEALTMSTTQQHWLIHRGELYLVYTRKSECNTLVARWRAPLYIARVDPDRCCLLKDTEKVVFPILGDGNTPPAHVPLMGNFHTLTISDRLSVVTVGENRSYDNYTGNVLFAAIQ